MDKFSIAKNGYNKIEVERSISNLEQKLLDKDKEIAELNKRLSEYKMQENKIKEKDENISIALTAAVEKAKQIEKSSQNVYKLKIQQLNILYTRWETLLNEFIKKYPDLKEVENIKQVLADFKKSIKSTIKSDFKFASVDSPVTSDSDSIRTLLGKMNAYISKSATKPKEVVRDRKPLTKDLQNSQSEMRRIEEKAPLIRPIYQKETNPQENILDKFLSEEDDKQSEYASIITNKSNKIPEVNETGFDLKEAVNPKDDLEEIMKSFDFFNANKK